MVTSLTSILSGSTNRWRKRFRKSVTLSCRPSMTTSRIVKRMKAPDSRWMAFWDSQRFCTKGRSSGHCSWGSSTDAMAEMTRARECRTMDLYKRVRQIAYIDEITYSCSTKRRSSNRDLMEVRRLTGTFNHGLSSSLFTCFLNSTAASWRTCNLPQRSVLDPHSRLTGTRWTYIGLRSNDSELKESRDAFGVGEECLKLRSGLIRVYQKYTRRIVGARSAQGPKRH